MPCYHPLKGWKSKSVNPVTGKRPVTFNRKQAYVDMPVTIPCGQCVGCRLERSRQWAIRCIHEAEMHEKNCFVTLTFNEEHLPKDRSIDVRHWQKFMKRLRKKYGSGIRYFHCGEYGDINMRPHYHAIIFGHDFDDKKLWKIKDENPLYVSDELQELWSHPKSGEPFGFCSLGAVTFQSCAYVARYIMKKQTGKSASDHYQWIDPETGEIHQRKPEYVTMSRRGGIGQAWLKKYKPDIFPNDFVVINGRKMRLPKYYDRQLELEHPAEFRSVKSARVVEAKRHSDNNTPERLKVREQVKLKQAERLIRPL